MSYARHCIAILFYLFYDVWLSRAASEVIESIERQLHQYSNNENSVMDRTLASSPDCWRNAMRMINADSTIATDVCKWMTTQHQKIMALELTRCHLHDLGRHLFEEATSDHPAAICSQENYRDNLVECLTHLTPSAEIAYTQFLTHINLLCIRLSRETVMDHFDESSLRLARISVEAEHKLKEMMKGQEEFWKAWSEREKEASVAHDQFKHDINQQRVRWVLETSQWRSQWHHEQEKWMLERQLVQQYELEEINKQTDELSRQRNELVQLSDTIARANQTIQPWSINLQSLYLYAQRAYHALKCMIYVTANLIVIWALTALRCLRWMRRYMWVIASLGYLLEAGFLITLSPHEEKSFLVSNHDLEFSDAWRELIIVSQIVFFVLGAVISPCRRGRDDIQGSSMAERLEANEMENVVLGNRPRSPNHVHGRRRDSLMDAGLQHSKVPDKTTPESLPAHNLVWPTMWAAPGHEHDMPMGIPPPMVPFPIGNVPLDHEIYFNSIQSPFFPDSRQYAARSTVGKSAHDSSDELVLGTIPLQGDTPTQQENWTFLKEAKRLKKNRKRRISTFKHSDDEELTPKCPRLLKTDDCKKDDSSTDIFEEQEEVEESHE